MPKLYPGYREEIRKKITAQALILFLEKGYDQVSMDDVATRLGVTRPAIYRYFRNKEDLFFSSVVETAMAEYREILSRSFASGDLTEGASLYFDELSRVSRKYEAITADMVSAVSRNKAMKDAVPALHERSFQVMQVFFEDQIDQGKIHTDLSGRELALVFNAFSEGMMHLILSCEDPVELKQSWLKGFAILTGNRMKKRSR